jgi:hypothetical protein
MQRRRRRPTLRLSDEAVQERLIEDKNETSVTRTCIADVERTRRSTRALRRSERAPAHIVAALRACHSNFTAAIGVRTQQCHTVYRGSNALKNRTKTGIVVRPRDDTGFCHCSHKIVP